MKFFTHVITVSITGAILWLLYLIVVLFIVNGVMKIYINGVSNFTRNANYIINLT